MPVVKEGICTFARLLRFCHSLDIDIPKYNFTLELFSKAAKTYYK